jgi:transcriptional regulator with XRE-family HTH domain
MKTFTESEVVELLKNGQGKKSQSEYAVKIGVSAQYLSDVYRGLRLPGPAILRHLKLERIYAPIQKKGK